MSATQLLSTGLTKAYRSRPALNGVSLAAQGGLVALLGPNGSGKTTLLQCLATVVEPDAGTLLIDGLDPRQEADRIEIRRRLGYLPQDPHLAKNARVFDALDYIALLKEHTGDRERHATVFRELDRVGLRDRALDRVGDLSGGMRQRLGLAQALLGTPTLLLLDEPTTGLDPDERARLRQIISQRRTDATVVMATHLTEATAMADTVLVMHDGVIRFHGSPAKLAQAAAGHTWIQHGPADAGVRASWYQPDGSHRCLGTPPPGATLVSPTIEDGYLLLASEPPPNEQ